MIILFNIYITMLPLMIPPITVKIIKAVISNDLTSVSEDLEYEASVRMIKIQPLETPDPGS